MWGEIDRMRGCMFELLDLRSKGVVRPKIDRAFRFAEAPLAHHYIQDHKNVGKVLLKPWACGPKVRWVGFSQMRLGC